LLSALGGKPVAAMGYTHLQDMCPAIVAMMWISICHKPRGRVSFAFFSIVSRWIRRRKLAA
jgi:cytochrome oxidase Cu insertion factor (SCO1/SenC/PrrC family)